MGIRDVAKIYLTNHPESAQVVVSEKGEVFPRHMNCKWYHFTREDLGIALEKPTELTTKKTTTKNAKVSKD